MATASARTIRLLELSEDIEGRGFGSEEVEGRGVGSELEGRIVDGSPESGIVEGLRG